MDWTALVCAACSHPVVEGRCATCRAARDEFRSQRPLRPDLVLLIAVLLAVIGLLAASVH